MPRKYSLSTKLVSIGAVLLVVALTSIGLTLWVTWQLEGGAAAVNEAGRLRMQTWRLDSTAQSSRDPQAVDALGRPGRVVGLLAGGLLALPSLFLYSRWRQWRFGSPAPDPDRPADVARARSLTMLCLAVGELPLIAGVLFHQFTGDGTVMMVLAGLSLGIMAAFRPGALFGRE